MDTTTGNSDLDVTSDVPSSVPPAPSTGFLDNPMVRWFGIVGVLFLLTLIVGGVNFCLWMSDNRKGFCRCRVGGGDGRESTRGSGTTNMAFSLGRARGSTSGHAG